MNNIISKEYEFVNEPILTYEEGSKEREDLIETYLKMKEEFVEIPLVIGGKEIKTEKTGKCVLPHNHNHEIGKYYLAGKEEATMAIEAALEAKDEWENIPWLEKKAIFLRAAELAAGPWRNRLNAATMLTQSKTYKQAEIDSACELVDFIKFNVKALHDIYSEQPLSTRTSINRIEYRPLEGFIFAVSPFNFTAIGSNLVGAPAIAGNTVVWKPASSQVYTAYVVYQLFKEAGVPDGVINFIPCSSRDIGTTIIDHEDLAGIHFTGSTEVFQNMWQTVGENIRNYNNFPRLVGETGGKNYVIAHKSADLKSLAKLLVEGSFEYQGQKCSAASRAYIPKGLWDEFKVELDKEMDKVKMGDVEDFNNFMSAVIDRSSFENIKSYVDYAKSSDEAEIIYGGNLDDSIGYFVEPTIILTSNPKFKTMVEEIFGPVLTIYLYEDDKYDEVLELANNTSEYGLTGSIFARCRQAIIKAEKVLNHSAGNFYINDRPTGAVVGQQPFGGGRLSGTNDKAGSRLNMQRWISPRVTKETLI